MDSRTQASLKSVGKLIDLLTSVGEAPAAHRSNPALRTALQSQSGTAKFQDLTREIEGVSLNTLKTIGRDHIKGGWAHVDSLRKAALAALMAEEHKDHVAATPRKETIAAALAVAREDLQQMRRANFVLLDAVGRALGDFAEVAASKSEQRRSKIIEDAVARIRSSLVTNPPPFDKADSRGLKLVHKSRP